MTTDEPVIRVGCTDPVIVNHIQTKVPTGMVVLLVDSSNIVGTLKSFTEGICEEIHDPKKKYNKNGNLLVLTITVSKRESRNMFKYLKELFNRLVCYIERVPYNKLEENKWFCADKNNQSPYVRSYDTYSELPFQGEIGVTYFIKDTHKIYLCVLGKYVEVEAPVPPVCEFIHVKDGFYIVNTWDSISTALAHYAEKQMLSIRQMSVDTTSYTKTFPSLVCFYTHQIGYGEIHNTVIESLPLDELKKVLKSYER